MHHFLQPRSASMRTFVVLGLAAALTHGSANVWAGTLLGIAPALPGSLPMGPFVGDSGIGSAPPNNVLITGTGVVTTNPSETWTKDIVWNYTASSINAGDRLSIMEEILLFSPAGSSTSMRVSDWHETIVGGSVPLAWSPDASVSYRMGGIPHAFQRSSVNRSPDGREIVFQFDPLGLGPPFNPGPIVLVISKYVTYPGPGVITSGGASAALTFSIRQQPSVPEPGTLVLAGLATAGALAIRRPAPSATLRWPA